MKKFIYVFSEEDGKRLLKLHYTLLKFNKIKKIYIFDNCEKSDSDLDGIDAVFTDTLIFWSEQDTVMGSDIDVGLH